MHVFLYFGTTYQLAVIVVVATGREPPSLLQAGQQSGFPLDVVAHNSGDASITTPASCDDNVVTAGHLDTTSLPGTKYRLVSF